MKTATGRGCGIFAFLIAAFGLFFAFQELVVTLQSSEPTEMTCAEYNDSQVDAYWLKLDECRVNLGEAVYETGFGDDAPVDAAYLPLHSADGDDGQSESGTKTRIVAYVEDPETTKLLTKLRDVVDGSVKDGKVQLNDESIEFYAEHRGELEQLRSFEGTVQYGLNYDSDEHERVAELSERLTSDFAIMTAGKRPSWTEVLATFATAGVFVAVGALFFFVLAGRGDEDESNYVDPDDIPEPARERGDGVG